MAREARARERAVVHTSAEPGGRGMAVTAGIATWDVRGCFPGGGRTVVAPTAVRHSWVVSKTNLRPARSRVALLAGRAAGNVARGTRARDTSVVTGITASADQGVIHTDRIPGTGHMTCLAIVAGSNMIGPLARNI